MDCSCSFSSARRPCCNSCNVCRLSGRCQSLSISIFGRQLLYGLIFILILSPDIVMGISLLILFSLVKLPLGFFSLLLAHITFCIPFVVVTVYGRIVSFDKFIFEAAKDLGATDTVIFTQLFCRYCGLRFSQAGC